MSHTGECWQDRPCTACRLAARVSELEAERDRLAAQTGALATLLAAHLSTDALAHVDAQLASSTRRVLAAVELAECIAEGEVLVDTSCTCGRRNPNEPPGEQTGDCWACRRVDTIEAYRATSTQEGGDGG